MKVFCMVQRGLCEDSAHAKPCSWRATLVSLSRLRAEPEIRVEHERENIALNGVNNVKLLEVGGKGGSPLS